MDFEGLTGEARAQAEQQRTVAPEFNAPPVIQLLSDDCELNGQIVQINRPDKLALLIPPRNADVQVAVGTGALTDVERAFADTLNGQAQPLGLR